MSCENLRMCKIVMRTRSDKDLACNRVHLRIHSLLPVFYGVCIARSLALIFLATIWRCTEVCVLYTRAWHSFCHVQVCPELTYWPFFRTLESFLSNHKGSKCEQGSFYDALLNPLSSFPTSKIVRDITMSTSLVGGVSRLMKGKRCGKI